MWSGIAKQALTVAMQATSDIQKHCEVCTEIERRRDEQHKQNTTLITGLQVSIERLYERFLTIGGAVFLVLLGIIAWLITNHGLDAATKQPTLIEQMQQLQQLQQVQQSVVPRKK